MSTTRRGTLLPQDEPDEVIVAGKLLFTAYVAYLVVEYRKHYGWKNFLNFCDVALFVTYFATCAPISHETKLAYISAASCGILLPQTVWIYDFLVVLANIPLLPRVGLANYMFNERLPAHLRLLSIFHLVLPVYLVFYLRRYGGYHEAGFSLWCAISLLATTASYAVSPLPSPDTDGERLPVNINYVYGWSTRREQRAFPRLVWLLLLNVLLAATYWTTHVILTWTVPRADLLRTV